MIPQKDVQRLREQLSVLKAQMKDEEGISGFETAITTAREKLFLEPERLLPTLELSQVLAIQVNIESALKKNLHLCKERIHWCKLENSGEDLEILDSLRSLETECLATLEAQSSLVLQMKRRLGGFVLELFAKEDKPTLTQSRNLYVVSDLNLRGLQENSKSAEADVKLFEECVTLCRERMKLLSSKWA